MSHAEDVAGALRLASTMMGEHRDTLQHQRDEVEAALGMLAAARDKLTSLGVVQVANDIEASSDYLLLTMTGANHPVAQDAKDAATEAVEASKGSSGSILDAVQQLDSLIGQVTNVVETQGTGVERLNKAHEKAAEYISVMGFAGGPPTPPTIPDQPPPDLMPV